MLRILEPATMFRTISVCVGVALVGACTLQRVSLQRFWCSQETSKRLFGFCLALVASLQIAIGFAQLPPEIAKYAYPETIFFNGKIVSMDDISISTNPGRTYQALAVKADKILKLGTNEEIRTLAGPETRLLDLKGRTMIPGIIEPHNHAYGSVLNQAERFGIKFPPNGIVTQFVADRSLEKSQAILRDTIQDAVKKVKPGDWIVVQANGNPAAPMEYQLWTMTRRFTNRKTLDTWAPNNPVMLDSIRGNINSKALAILDDFLPGYSASIQETMHGQTRQMYRRTGVLQGIGDDYFWIDGVASERWDSTYPESCTGPDTKAPAHIKAREVCPKPGDLPWDVLQTAMKSGWRLAGVHMCGSESARAFFRMIEGARVANGWTVQEVHDMHTSRSYPLMEAGFNSRNKNYKN